MQAKEIFLLAIDIEDAAEREVFVNEKCGEDIALKRKVLALLAANEDPESFLDHPAARFEDRPAGLTQTTDSSPISQKPGDMIGPYKLLQQIGVGGMGVVYMAEQSKPVVRRVALKIIKPGMDSKQVIARFEAERQALALMDHPNIAKVLDAGETELGRPYFVMELVKGVPLTDYCDEHHLNPRQRLELFRHVLYAVQHAHQKGIIHRDLKPSNVLVAEYDHQAVPKVIDFGVAKATSQKLTDKTMFTQYGQLVGTFEYMSPEQAKLNQMDIDTRSDIYSLGVLLYELLTGDTPFDRKRLHSAAFDELLRIIREEEPPLPSTRLSTSATLAAVSAKRNTEPRRLSTLVRGELDWIVMKTLEKDRTRRYETVSQLATEIQRYLDGEPVEACPPSLVYRLSKFASRHRAAVLVSACFLLLIAGSTVLSWALYARARHARDLALAAQAESLRDRDHALEAEHNAAQHLKTATEEKERADNQALELKQKLYDYSIIKANAAYRERDMKTVSNRLSECLPEQRGWEWSFLNLQASATRVMHLPGNRNWEYALTADMARIVIVDGEGFVRCVKLSDGSLLWSKKSEISIPSGSVISPNDQLFILTGSRRTPGQSESARQTQEGTIQAFSIANGELLWTQKPSSAATFLPSFCSDGTQFLVTVATSSSSSEVQLRSSADGNTIWTTPASAIAQAVMNQAGTRLFISEAHNASNGAPSELRCLHAKDRSQLWKVSRPEETSGILLSPDDTELLATGKNLSLIFFDSETGKHKQTVESSTREMGLMVLGSSLGNNVLTVAQSGLFVVWDWKTRRPIEASKAASEGLGMRLAADGSQLAFLVGESNLLHIRPAQAASESLILVGHGSGFKGARFIDSNNLCSVGNEGAWRVWQTSTGKELAATAMDAGGLELEVSSDGSWIAAATTKGTKIWDRTTSKLLQEWPQDGQSWFVKRNASGTLLATAGQQGILRLYEAKDAAGNGLWSTKVDKPSREFEASASIHGLAVTPDGNTICTLDSPGCEVIIWNAKSGGREVLRNSQPGQTGRTAELSPDGRLLAIGVEQTVEIWDLSSQTMIAVLRDADSKVFSLTFDRSGSRLFAGTGNGAIFLWNLASRELLLNYKAHTSNIVCLAMSSDNATLASSSVGGELKLWETQLLTPEVAAQRDLVQRATFQANRLLVQHQTPKVALQHLVQVEALPEELMSTAMSILQARMNAPVNLNVLATATGSVNAEKSSPVKAAILSAHSLKEKIDAAIGKDLLGLLHPNAEAPNLLSAEKWNSLCRALVQKSRFNLEPAQLIALLQQIKDNGDAPHYIFYLKAVAHLQISQCENAEQEMSSAIALVPAKSPLWFTYAFRLSFLQAYVGKWEAYHKLCTEALENYDDTQDYVLLERLAKMCLFSERGGLDVQIAGAVADRAHAETEFLAPKIFERLTVGIADLRRERYEAALEHFNFVVRTGLPGDKVGHDITTALAKLYIAIASHHLGRHEEAQKQLKESAAVVQNFPTTSGWWPDWMMASTVLKEAEELISRNKETTP